MRIINSHPIRHENDSGHFAYSFNFYQLFWIFIFGNISGTIVEMIWCLLKNGHIERRSALIYGPFNIVYGIGALALYLGLRNFDSEKKVSIFTIGMVAGMIVEYICSWVQERVFGTVSWDYSNVPFNIGGRICLPYAILWGALALLWVYCLYPFFRQMMLKLSDSMGKVLARFLLVFLIFNICISSVAVARWKMRAENIPAANIIDEKMDVFYPDIRMEHLYPNMQFNE